VETKSLVGLPRAAQGERWLAKILVEHLGAKCALSEQVIGYNFNNDLR
jgi:hypothetical protein